MTDRGMRWLCCSLVAAVAACAAPPRAPAPLPMAQSAAAPVSLEAAYERSIRAAAVRTPDYAIALRSIPPTQSRVVVGTFTQWGPPPSPTQRMIWISLPDQLRGFCRGAKDPVLALQEALGLPPQARPSSPQQQWQIITFTVPRSALFRPCPGGTDIGAPRCANTLASAGSGATARGGSLDPAMTRFLLGQIWSSDRVGFHNADGTPDWGYPFTGMGWTYNWDPHAASPIGVSEFVVRPGTRISAVHAVTPRQFCGVPTAP